MSVEDDTNQGTAVEIVKNSQNIETQVSQS